MKRIQELWSITPMQILKLRLEYILVDEDISTARMSLRSDELEALKIATKVYTFCSNFIDDFLLFCSLIRRQTLLFNSCISKLHFLQSWSTGNVLFTRLQ